MTTRTGKRNNSVTSRPLQPDLNRSFRKSSYSQSEAACVEVADGYPDTALRDTKHREFGALSFPLVEWRAFVDTVKHRSL